MGEKEQNHHSGIYCESVQFFKIVLHCLKTNNTFTHNGKEWLLFHKEGDVPQNGQNDLDGASDDEDNRSCCKAEIEKNSEGQDC